MNECTKCKKTHENYNTGCNNIGYRNIGDYNSGNYNSGGYNSGYCNSGYCNSGDYNSGNYNSGNYNTGCNNSGYRNSGNYNSGDYNSGWFNTEEQTMRFFNKETTIKFSDFVVEVYPDLKICTWIAIDKLPEAEQTETAKQMGGLLKTMTYKEAWKEYWERASEKDKRWFQTLPNFTPEIFEEITGINVAKQSLSGKEVQVTIDGVNYSAVIK